MQFYKLMTYSLQIECGLERMSIDKVGTDLLLLLLQMLRNSQPKLGGQTQTEMGVRGGQMMTCDT